MGEALQVEDIVHRVIDYFGEEVDNPHSRFRSWDYCYQYFQRMGPEGISRERDNAANWLGFYLASWGMYRGSSFLLHHAYTIHLKAIDCLASPRWKDLWGYEFGAQPNDVKYADTIAELGNCVWQTYAPKEPSATLLTKIMLGTLACTPAMDTYFGIGFRNHYQCCDFNKTFVTNVLEFCEDNRAALQTAQVTVQKTVGTRYPLIKLVDMYFFQVGWEQSAK